MVGFATGPHIRNFDWVRANGSGKAKNEKNYSISQANSLIQSNNLQGT